MSPVNLLFILLHDQQASNTTRIPRHLSGVPLKPFRLGIIPAVAFCPQKKMLACMVYAHSSLHVRMIERHIPHMILDRTPSKP